MKKEWTDGELNIVLKTIKRWINSRKFVTMHQGELGLIASIRDLENMLGLPYTSSGRAATVAITNTELYLDERKMWKVDCFEMDDEDVIYAVCTDRDSNELLIPITK